MVYDIEVLK